MNILHLFKLFDPTLFPIIYAYLLFKRLFLVIFWLFHLRLLLVIISYFWLF
jgi:hypothetical protein